MNYFQYAGVRSSTYGILIDHHDADSVPTRDYETVEVPGRNGTLTVDNGRYHNIDLTYTCGIGQNFRSRFADFRAWLFSQTGYQRLEDSYDPLHYRRARVKSVSSLDTALRGSLGTFDVVFDCQPQRFLKSGETAQTFTGSGSLTNPTRYPALPLVRAYGTGTVKIGSNTITINTASSYTDLDCDLQDAYRGATNCNGNITLNSGNFFTLTPGYNGISLGNGISRVEITPGWWTL